MSETDILVCEDEEADKASSALDEVLEVLRKHKLRVQDLILLYGNLGYSLGASIEGLTEGLTVEELQKKYYENPTVGVTLMLQGLLTTTWKDDYLKQQISSKQETK
jgi:hypothetical protein